MKRLILLGPLVITSCGGNMELPENMETTSVVEIRAAVDNTGVPAWSEYSETRTFVTLPDEVSPPPEPPPVKPGKGHGKGGKK